MEAYLIVIVYWTFRTNPIRITITKIFSISWYSNMLNRCGLCNLFAGKADLYVNVTVNVCIMQTVWICVRVARVWIHQITVCKNCVSAKTPSIRPASSIEGNIESSHSEAVEGGTANRDRSIVQIDIDSQSNVSLLTAVRGINTKLDMLSAVPDKVD